MFTVFLLCLTGVAGAQWPGSATLEVTGKDPRATGYLVGLDGFVL